MSFEADKFLEDVSGRFAKPYAKALSDLFVARVRGNVFAGRDALAAFANLQRETMAVAEIYGARLALRRASKTIAQAADINFGAEQLGGGERVKADLRRLRKDLVTFANQMILPAVTLQEALDDMISRTPVTLRRAAERTAQRIAQLYSEERVAAFARSAEAVVTKEAQDFIARAIREGIAEADAGKRLSMSIERIRVESQAWTEGYARTVFRTNVNTAVTAGRFRQVQDQDVRSVIPAFRFDAVGDADTRSNHKAADGMILRVDNTAWNRIAPPLGYNCRCQVSMVSIIDLEAMGRVDNDGAVIESRIPAGAFPDEGFRHGGRPDLFIVDGGGT